MADTSTPGFTYTPPPDFFNRRQVINDAYSTAQKTLAHQQSAIQNRYGYTDDGKGLDVNAQYGLVQQNDHQEGQALMQDDAAEYGRGFGGGADSGLGAQRARLLRYQSGLQDMNTANARTGESDANYAAQTAANSQKNSDLYGVDQDEAAWNSGQSALRDAQAAWNRANPPADTPDASQAPVTGGYQPLVATKGHALIAPQNAGIAPTAGVNTTRLASTKAKAPVNARQTAYNNRF